MSDDTPQLPDFIQRFLAIQPGGMSHAGTLMACMIGVLAACAWMLGGLSMMISAGIAVAMMLALTPMISPDILMKILRASPLPAKDYLAIHEMNHLLSDRAGLDHRPNLFILPGKGVNAITTGTDDHTTIAISSDALHNLSPRQMRAILAHEVAHAWHGDTRILLITDVLYRATWTIALFGLAIFIFGDFNPPAWMIVVFGAVPTISFLLQRAVIRDREFAADHGASDLLNGPEDMIDALLHIDQINRTRLRIIPYRSTQPPSLLDTHPSVTARIKALRALKPGTWQKFFENRKMPEQ
ncbi:M48 family metalloprotease [Thalassospira profundimaris]|uniref:Peptidase M48 n=1 Tax=Thalassospira profundimaris TaxID=502049 RepID=A0A367X9V6_9PROT|nr:M48 family metalloprotease [Thalassospira profundimaris]RCK49462.1 peptidase M48 [Thalassospira profundimaris]